MFTLIEYTYSEGDDNIHCAFGAYSHLNTIYSLDLSPFQQWQDTGPRISSWTSGILSFFSWVKVIGAAVIVDQYLWL